MWSTITARMRGPEKVGDFATYFRRRNGRCRHRTRRNPDLKLGLTENKIQSTRLFVVRDQCPLLEREAAGNLLNRVKRQQLYQLTRGFECKRLLTTVSRSAGIIHRQRKVVRTGTVVSGLKPSNPKLTLKGGHDDPKQCYTTRQQAGR
jgi:hypothetical protein